MLSDYRIKSCKNIKSCIVFCSGAHSPMPDGPIVWRVYSKYISLLLLSHHPNIYLTFYSALMHSSLVLGFWSHFEASIPCKDWVNNYYAGTIFLKYCLQIGRAHV